MKVCITGVTGGVGQKLLPRLLQQHHDLHAVVRVASTTIEQLKIRTFIGEVGDPSAMARAAEGCECFIHLAAAFRGSSREEIMWTNVAGTENALKAARYAGVQRFILISCADVSLTHEDRVHWDEKKLPERFIADPFANSKRLAEDIALTMDSESMHVLALRPAIIWGLQDRYWFPRWTAEAKAGGIRLFGAGESWMGTTHIDNLTQAIVAALNAPTSAYGQTYYVTDGDLIEVQRFFAELSRVHNWPSPRRSIPARLALLQARFARDDATAVDVTLRTRGSAFNIQKAMSALAYRPQVSFEQGLTTYQLLP